MTPPYSFPLFHIQDHTTFLDSLLLWHSSWDWLVASNHNILVLFALVIIFIHIVLLLGLAGALDAAHHGLVKVEIVIES